MNAINKLRQTGLTTAQIAAALPGTSGTHLVRLYERGLRFPTKTNYICLVELAESRKILLLAHDFIRSTDHCEK